LRVGPAPRQKPTTRFEASKKYGVLKGDVDVDSFVNLG
jgi:hypothetical protein